MPGEGRLVELPEELADIDRETWDRLARALRFLRAEGGGQAHLRLDVHPQWPMRCRVLTQQEDSSAVRGRPRVS